MMYKCAPSKGSHTIWAATLTWRTPFNTKGQTGNRSSVWPAATLHRVLLVKNWWDLIYICIERERDTYVYRYKYIYAVFHRLRRRKSSPNQPAHRIYACMHKPYRAERGMRSEATRLLSANCTQHRLKSAHDTDQKLHITETNKKKEKQTKQCT